MKKPMLFKTDAFAIPSILGFLLFYIVPMIFAVKYAFTDAPISGRFAGFDNFKNILGNEAFVLAARNTLKFTALSLPLNMVIPLCIALLLEKITDRRLITAVFMSPLIIPSACIAFLFQSFFADNGFVSALTGVRQYWLDTDYSFAIAVLIYVWKNVGYNLVLYLAGLSGIPADYFEWAVMEGMGNLRFFFTIRLIYLMPTFFIVFVMSFINSFKVYKELYMLAGDYPNDKIYMLQHYMNNQFISLNYLNLTAASLLIIGVISIAVVLFFIAERKCGE